MSEEEIVFLGSVTHSGQIDYRMARSFYITASQNYPIEWKMQQTSLLASGCNEIWCSALNERSRKNLKWFAFLHTDIVPEPWWIDKLITIADANGADLLSAVVPIKGPDGVTSTALASDQDPFTRYTRLTQRQVLHEAFPETFNVFQAVDALKNLPEDLRLPDTPLNPLLVNTGCMVCRIDQPWSDEVYFTINDRITRALGKYIAQVEPEDWFFSKMVAYRGGKVMATKAIKVQHIGTMAYRSESVWGSNIDPATL